jgi:hypothetical protein
MTGTGTVPGPWEQRTSTARRRGAELRPMAPMDGAQVTNSCWCLRSQGRTISTWGLWLMLVLMWPSLRSNHTDAISMLPSFVSLREWKPYGIFQEQLVEIDTLNIFLMPPIATPTCIMFNSRLARANHLITHGSCTYLINSSISSVQTAGGLIFIRGKWAMMSSNCVVLRHVHRIFALHFIAGKVISARNWIFCIVWPQIFHSKRYIHVITSLHSTLELVGLNFKIYTPVMYLELGSQQDLCQIKLGDGCI